MTILAKSPDLETADDKTARASQGFGLIESLMAVLVLALGLMFVGPMMVRSVNSTTLARSKDTAVLAATNQLEALAVLYRANADDPNLTLGAHAPIQVTIVNPNDNDQLNRYNVGWTVSSVPDPRAGKQLRAVEVTVTVTPIGTGGAENVKALQNKITSVTTIFSFRI